jgi:hypothetical protein
VSADRRLRLRRSADRELRRGSRRRIAWALRLWGPVWARDLWLVLVTATVFWAALHVTTEQDRQREGRRVAIRVLCAGEQAVIVAGREQILAGAELGPPRLVRNLERLGLPAVTLRRQQAEAAARAYSERIAAAVRDESGVRDLVDPATGVLRCDRLVRASRVGAR